MALVDATLRAAHGHAKWPHITMQDMQALQQEAIQAVQKGKQSSSTQLPRPVDILKMDWTSAIAGQKSPAKPSKAGRKKAASKAGTSGASAKLVNGSQHSLTSRQGQEQSGDAEPMNVAEAGSSIADVPTSGAGVAVVAANSIDGVSAASRAAARDSGGPEVAVGLLCPKEPT